MQKQDPDQQHKPETQEQQPGGMIINLAAA
jgi:hypothetical protein